MLLVGTRCWLLRLGRTRCSAKEDPSASVRDAFGMTLMKSLRANKRSGMTSIRCHPERVAKRRVVGRRLNVYTIALPGRRRWTWARFARGGRIDRDSTARSKAHDPPRCWNDRGGRALSVAWDHT